MKRLLLTLSFIIFHLSFSVAQKTIYIPEDLRSMNLESDTSQWCWKRSAETRDLIFMWERGFGNDLQSPPRLEGKPMDFNLSVLMERVQTFYTFFRDSLGWIETHPQPLPVGRGENTSNSDINGLQGNPSPPLKGGVGGGSTHSKADLYKMMVMVMYSLDGTAYGGTYDNYIGALWVAPNRIQDKTMNCMAHELGHSFQSQIMADSVGQCWGGTGFFEMASQWMLWQVNPWWLRDENYHFEAFKGLTHKAFLAMDNIYHSPYVLQWWSDLHGRKSIAELFRQGRIGEDPVMTYKRMYGLTQQQFCEEMLQGYCHLVNFDFNHARQETRPYACTWSTPLDTLRGGWLQPKTTLEDYGFHIIPLGTAKRKPKVQVKGRDVLFSLVGVEGKYYLVVMGAPKEHRMLSDEPVRTYPYQLKVK